MEFVLDWRFFFFFCSVLDFDDLVSLETLSSPYFPPFSGFALRFLPIFSHYVTELALMFSEHPCHMQDTEFDTHGHGSSMALCLRWLHTYLHDWTLYYFSFVVYAVTPPSKKEMIQSSCTFICISHAFTVGFLYFCFLFL